MGIKFLNHFLRENCPTSIRYIHFSELSGKRIAIDISIYLYKYETANTLLENIYLMLATFRHFGIIPVFIFDGRPPDEKKELLKKRRQDKLLAQSEYNNLSAKLENMNLNSTVEQDVSLVNSEKEELKQELISEMASLKKQFISITRDQINNVKNLMRAFGATYYDAPGEADALCAMLVVTKRVWGCLSEDMDLFVYGCSRVLRYVSLTSQSAILYCTKGILEELNMSQNEFKDVCILSGTDYNTENYNNSSFSNNVVSIMQLFEKYKQTKPTTITTDMTSDMITNSFYHWIQKETNMEIKIDVELLEKIRKIFDFSNELFQKFKNIKILNGPIQKETIKTIMREDGFIFM